MGTVEHPLLIFVTDKSDRINFTAERCILHLCYAHRLVFEATKLHPFYGEPSTNEILTNSTNQLTFRHNRGLIALFVSSI